MKVHGLNQSGIDHDDRTECDFCGTAADMIYNIKDDVPADKRYKANLCEVCWSTHCGNIHHYSHQYSNGVYTLATILAQRTNLILNAIKANAQPTLVNLPPPAEPLDDDLPF